MSTQYPFIRSASGILVLKARVCDSIVVKVNPL